MDVYYPYKRSINTAGNGSQLLSNLLIPGLSIDDMLGKIQSGNESVKLRINGGSATIVQVNPLLPKIFTIYILIFTK